MKTIKYLKDDEANPQSEGNRSLSKIINLIELSDLS